ncbi:MAG: hypothetical protein IJR85_10925 [Synergistaceae bacterium]|nr:hypothetical protein [Synergistaceae bacterium]
MMIFCALCYAFAVSVSSSLYVLLAESILPVILLCRKKFPLPYILKLNVINALMVITLALTWPDLREGLMMGMVIAWRVNIIYVVFAALVFPLGLGAVYSLAMPEKFRVLVILTVRGIFILRDSLDSALVSAKLRAPDAGLMMRLKIFAYVLGSVLIRSANRSERMTQAVELRGGFKGFMQDRKGEAAC